MDSVPRIFVTAVNVQNPTIFIKIILNHSSFSTSRHGKEISNILKSSVCEHNVKPAIYKENYI